MPPKISSQYHLGGSTALFRCSSYCKHVPPTVNMAPPIVNSAFPTVNMAPPTVNATPPIVNTAPLTVSRAPPIVNVYSRGSRVYNRRRMLTVGGAHKHGRGTPLMVLGTIFWGIYIF